MYSHLISTSEKIQNKVLKGMAIAFGFFCIILIATNIYLQAYTLAIIEFFLVLTCIFVYHKAKNNLLGGWNLYVLPYFFLSIVIYGTYIKELNEGLFLWCYIVPTLFYLLYGQKHGFIIATLVAIIQIVNIMSKQDSQLYNITVISINFILAYFSIWLVSHIYETNREKAQKQLKELALRDPLTGAYNRLALQYFFDKKMKAQNTLSIAIIDLDLFKEVNDSFGHEAGDIILQECVTLLKQSTEDNQVFRLGGEEFALLIPADLHNTFELINNIRLTIEQNTTQYKEHSISFTFSAGISQCLPDRSLSHTLDDADLKLYQAKNNGRNQVQVKSKLVK